MHNHPSNVQSSYDKVASKYALHFFNEQEGKPMDRIQLQRFTDRLNGRGPVCDLGCGPGQIARFLQQCGANSVFGIDLSHQMVAQANESSGGIPFRQGNMLALTDADCSWAGAAAFYSIVHFSLEEVRQAFKEVYRVLQPGGWLLVAFHIGEEVVHIDRWWEQDVNLNFVFFNTGKIEGLLQEIGFCVDEIIERDPYPEIEHPSQRAYIFAKRPFKE
jgi:ubiquinone/menaquinone biosynthesis C-methylase UbiE